MRNYFRVMLGRKSSLAERCFTEGFLGIEDGTGDLTPYSIDYPEFRDHVGPILKAKNPERTKIGVGLACAVMWNLSKRIQDHDIVLSPDGSGRYRIGDVEGGYFYQVGEVLAHRRRIRWREQYIDRSAMSAALKGSTGSVQTIVHISPHTEEIERLIGGQLGVVSTVGTSATVVEDITAFAMEKHLEDFLVQNWAQTELGREYDIYSQDGERVGQQFPTDTGPLDILALSKDRKTLLVVELKRGRASDAVVGQTLRYMGFVHAELAEEGQSVKGAIIALEDDQRIRRALSLIPAISFYRYQISFKLVRA